MHLSSFFLTSQRDGRLAEITGRRTTLSGRLPYHSPFHPLKYSDLHVLHNWALRVWGSSCSKCFNATGPMQRSLGTEILVRVSGGEAHLMLKNFQLSMPNGSSNFALFSIYFANVIDSLSHTRTVESVLEATKHVNANGQNSTHRQAKTP